MRGAEILDRIEELTWNWLESNGTFYAESGYFPPLFDRLTLLHLLARVRWQRETREERRCGTTRKKRR